MTFRQAREFKTALKAFSEKLTEFHHGDCIGADDEAATIVHFTLPHVKIHSHPCTYPMMRAHNPYTDIEYPILRPFERNRVIVNTCSNMVGISWTEEESLSGGTWYTINYAKRQHCNLLIIFPKRIESWHSSL